MPRIEIHLPRRWQHARGLRLIVAFIRLALATRSGVVPQIGIPSPRRWQYARGLHLELTLLRPGVGNKLRGCISNWHSFTPALATCSGATLNARILVAIYQFGCRMSNMKVSPRFATPDGPVFVSSALCREIFHTYVMKFAPMDASGASQWTGLRPGKCNAARVEVAPAQAGSSRGTRI
jgi:hypothetical protein